MMESLHGGIDFRKLVQGLERFLLRRVHKKWVFQKLNVKSRTDMYFIGKVAAR